VRLVSSKVSRPPTTSPSSGLAQSMTRVSCLGATSGRRLRVGSPTAVVKRALLDTGFVVALVNGSDPDHDRCVAVWRELRAALYSVDGVTVEAAHLLGRVRNGAANAVRLIHASGTRLIPTTSERVERALVLMEKYRDVPMDWVDALLVVVAEEERISDVLTLDRRGFDVYRLRGRGRFRILPA
jgi:uncharacterized protein